eukprot:scaffold303409_cov21-Tisochrysis_lutea.AAC.1
MDGCYCPAVPHPGQTDGMDASQPGEPPDGKKWLLAAPQARMQCSFKHLDQPKLSRSIRKPFFMPQFKLWPRGLQHTIMASLPTTDQTFVYKTSVELMHIFSAKVPLEGSFARGLTPRT